MKTINIIMASMVFIFSIFSVDVIMGKDDSNISQIEEDDNDNDNNVERLTLDVVCTIYNPCPEQGWGNGDILYDGTKISKQKASGYRYIAISHDLINEHGFKMGDLVYVSGLDEYYNGYWEVRDLMNKKWSKRIDFLQSKGSNPPKLQNCKITLIDNIKDLLVGV